MRYQWLFHDGLISVGLAPAKATASPKSDNSHKNKMRPLKHTALIAVLCAGLASVASAHLLDPTFFTTASPIGSPSNEATYLENNFGTGGLTYLAKFDVGGSESGAVD